MLADEIARLRHASTLALDALDALLAPVREDANHDGWDARDVRDWKNAAERLRAALAQQRQPRREPGWNGPMVDDEGEAK